MSAETARKSACATILLAALAVTSLDAGELRVTGEDLAWRVETPWLIVDMSKNPGTGRSGQINTIFYKPAGVLLWRDRTTSTLHLSPNSAPGTRWNGINRWDPPAACSAAKTARGFRVDREGPMPFTPDLYVKTSYEIFSDEPVIAVEESIEARADASLTLMRLCEWSFSPEAENPFTHIAWADAGGKVTVKKKEKTEDLPVDLRWMAFFNPEKRLGFAAIVERFEPGKFLWHPASRFAGDPHYFYRGSVLSPDQKPVIVPRGNRCSIRYSIFLFQPGPGPQALDPVIQRARR